MGASWSCAVPRVTSLHVRVACASACLGLIGYLSVHFFQQSLRSVADDSAKAPLVAAKKTKVPLVIDRPDDKIEDVYTITAQKVGEGSFGTVFKACHTVTGEEVAIKKIPKNGMTDGSEIANEIDISRSLNHPNIIKLLETYEDAKFVYLVEELAKGGELFDHIIDGTFRAGPSLDGTACKIMHQVFSAVQYCHAQNICCRGVKPEDIVCMTRGPIDKVVLKLTDFGQYCRAGPDEYMVTKLGTPYYVAPQVLTGFYDRLCDCWSCGVVMYVVLCGYPPFFADTDAETLAKVRLGNYSFNALRGRDQNGRPLPGPTRLRSCSGPKGSVWMIVPPTTEHVVFSFSKNVSSNGGVQLALWSIVGNEAARFDYEVSPTVAMLKVDAARKLELHPKQIEIMSSDETVLGDEYQFD